MSSKSPTRRRVVGTIGVGAATVALTGVARAGTGRAASAGDEQVNADARRAWETSTARTGGGGGPWWLFAPLQAGQTVGEGWQLAELSVVTRGAAVLTLVHPDRDPAVDGLARVHLCAHDGQPRGLAHTAMLDFILMDGGDGGRMTDEGLGRVPLGLAALARRNELDEAGDLRELGRMQPHAERVSRYGPETLS